MLVSPALSAGRRETLLLQCMAGAFNPVQAKQCRHAGILLGGGGRRTACTWTACSAFWATTSA